MEFILLEHKIRFIVSSDKNEARGKTLKIKSSSLPYSRVSAKFFGNSVEFRKIFWIAEQSCWHPTWSYFGQPIAEDLFRGLIRLNSWCDHFSNFFTSMRNFEQSWPKFGSKRSFEGDGKGNLTYWWVFIGFVVHGFDKFDNGWRSSELELEIGCPQQKKYQKFCLR